MSSVVISGDTSGSITLSAPAVAGSNTITLPAASGVLQVSGNMPAFSAYLSSAQTVTTNTFTKMACDTEEFDTNSNYNTSNYRFTPTVAGYYQVSGSVCVNATASDGAAIAVYKNGSTFKWGTYITRTGIALDMDVNVSALIYLNGSTDYIELYGYVNGTGTCTFSVAVGGQYRDYFQAVLVRGA